MTMQITRRDIDRAHALVRRQQRDAERDQARKETYTSQLMQTAEIGAGALASGVLSGRFGALSLGPIPLDLLAGLGLHALGFSNMLGNWSDDAHNIGDGMLAAYLVKLGAGLGTEWRLRAGQSPFVTSGADPALYPYAQPAYPAYAPAAVDPAYGGTGPLPAYAGVPMWQQGGLTDAELQTLAAMG